MSALERQPKSGNEAQKNWSLTGKPQEVCGPCSGNCPSCNEQARLDYLAQLFCGVPFEELVSDPEKRGLALRAFVYKDDQNEEPESLKDQT